MAGKSKPAVLFLCTGNSCRSQMAEGWARSLYPERYEVYSAGIEAHGVNPRAVRVMQEAGVDISGQRSERLKDLTAANFDVIITVCGHADEKCPSVPDTCLKLHLPLDDPPALARNATSEQEALQHYRRVRDEIRDLVSRLPQLLAGRERGARDDNAQDGSGCDTKDS